MNKTGASFSVSLKEDKWFSYKNQFYQENNVITVMKSKY